jgi:phosphotransacetylase
MEFASRLLAAAAAAPRRIAFPESDEPRTLRAVARLAEKGIVQPVLVGPRASVERAAAREGVSLGGIPVLDPTDPRCAPARATLPPPRSRGRGCARRISRA